MKLMTRREAVRLTAGCAAAAAACALPGNAFADDAQSTLRENSWRYRDGVSCLSDDALRARAATRAVPGAWTRTPNGYLSSDGSVIDGAWRRGIDVSEHQGRIDWDAVLNDDVGFVVIRCGYGDDYDFQDDKQWLRNVAECERLGIPYGVYLYSYAENTAMAASEADHVLRLLAGHSPLYPVYLDLEEDRIAASLSRRELAAIASTFCDQIARAGYRPGVYANLNWWNNHLTDPVFDSWERWVAQYNVTCDYAGPYRIWQCTSKASVSGISGDVDLNFQLGYPDDVAADDWYVSSGAFDYVWFRGIMGAYSGTNDFGPYDSVTRAQAVTIFWRMAGSPVRQAEPFADVDYGAWYGPAVNWGRATGVVSGYQAPDGSYPTFGPDDPVTREQLAVFFVNFARIVRGANVSSDATSLKGKADAALVSPWARESLGWCVDNGIVNGVREGGVDHLAPQDNAWRSSMASMAMRFDEVVR